MSSLSILCSGTEVLDFIEWIIVEVPNNPVNKGSSGSWTFEFKDAKPRNPARIKIITAFDLESFSLYNQEPLVLLRDDLRRGSEVCGQAKHRVRYPLRVHREKLMG